MFKPIETTRLLLRPFEPRDAAGMFAYASDIETTRYMSFPIHKSVQDSVAVIEIFRAAAVAGTDFPVAFERKSDGRVIGSSGLHGFGYGGASCGWILHSEARGQGYGREGVAAVLAWGFSAWPELSCIEAAIRPQNTDSIRLAESVGMVQVGSKKSAMPNIGPGLFDMNLYRILKP